MVLTTRVPRARHNSGVKRKSCAVPRGLGLRLDAPPPLKRWAIIFRARGARVVPVSPSTRVPQAEQQVPRLGPKPSLGMTVLATEANLGRGQGWNRLTRESRLAGRKSLAQRFSAGKAVYRKRVP